MIQDRHNIKTNRYLGNPLVKRDNVSLNFSQEEVQEYIKCARDPIYFCKTYIKVIHLDRGLVNFDLYDYQENMINHFVDNNLSIVLACRQSGKSITTIGFVIWYICFNPEKTVYLLANKGATAREMLGRLTLMLEHLPFFLQPGCKELNKGSISFSNNSKVRAAATSSNSIRGQSANLIVLDEFAFVNDAAKFFTSTYPVISSGKTSKVIITSTPNGIGNMFHSIWEGAVQGISDFKPFTVRWWDVPGRDEAWKARTIANTSAEQFRQEFEIEFLGSGSTLLDANTLLSLKSVEPISVLQNGSLNVYEEPIKANPEDDKSVDHFYIMTVDVSQGRGQDCSAFSVFDITAKPFRQVATFNDNKVSPLVFPNIIVNMAKHFNEALVLVESNGPGQIVCNSIWYDFEYENLFVESSMKAGGLGVTQTKKTKRIGTSNLKDFVEGGKLIVVDKETIRQLCYFEECGTSFKAAGVEFDDMVMTLVIFSWFLSSTAFGNYDDLDLRKMIFENELRKIDDDMVDFGALVGETATDSLSPEYDSLRNDLLEWKQ
jgi:hypothetical protein